MPARCASNGRQTLRIQQQQRAETVQSETAQRIAAARQNNVRLVVCDQLRRRRDRQRAARTGGRERQYRPVRAELPGDQVCRCRAFMKPQHSVTGAPGLEQIAHELLRAQHPADGCAENDADPL